MASSPTFLRLQLGKQLRKLRESAGLAPDATGAEVDCSGSTIYRIEAGQVGLKRPLLMALLDLYGVTDKAHRETLAAMAKEGNQRGWWARYKDLPATYTQYIDLESAATAVRDYQSVVVTGLLQTEEYARARITAGRALMLTGRASETTDQVELRVKIRMDRQQVLTRPEPLPLWAVLDESVLHREIGGPGVLRDQLAHLIEVSELLNVTVQVLPYTGGPYAGITGSFAVLDLAGSPTVAYVEGLTGDLYLDDDDVERYTLVFDHLRAAALQPEKSIRLVKEAWARLSHEE